VASIADGTRAENEPRVRMRPVFLQDRGRSQGELSAGCEEGDAARQRRDEPGEHGRKESLGDEQGRLDVLLINEAQGRV
jgi:hypothetical protein